MNALSKACIIAVQLMLASAPAAQATPSPGIVISDHIVGTTPDSFFVIRTTTLQPPTYYQRHMRVEFVELSNSDGSIVDRCVLRETEYASDAGVDPETWTQTETQKPACRVFDMLPRRNAGYMEPGSTGVGPAAYRLAAKGLEAREETSDGSVIWTGLLSGKTIMARAAKSTSLSASGIPWQTGLEPSDTLSLVGTDGEKRYVQEVCELDPAPVTSRDNDWMFLRFICWPGDADADGANFYIALKHKQ